MISLLIRFLILVAIAATFAWLADRPGNLRLQWLGYDIETSLMAAIIFVALVAALLWFVWSLLAWLLDRPGALGGWFRSRRRRKARQALANGLIAVAAGDAESARGHARTATAILGEDPIATLLDAQASQLRGDHARVRSIFNAMRDKPETRLLGLRGLHREAVRQGDLARARQLAEEAIAINPKLAWAEEAALGYQAAARDWEAIGQTLDAQKAAGLIDTGTAARKRAVLLMAQSREAAASDPVQAGELAVQANRLDPALVPAATVAARHLADTGSLRRASRILEKAWKLSPHPDIAETYAHLRPGDSAADRLKRVSTLTRKSDSREAAIAVAVAAIEAQEWATARDALEPFTQDRPQARICALMAEIEEHGFGDAGRSREWLARAVHAPRDPAWTADGFISKVWLPVSPVSGQLGAFEWKVPVEGIVYEEADVPAGDGPVPGDEARLIETAAQHAPPGAHAGQPASGAANRASTSDEPAATLDAEVGSRDEGSDVDEERPHLEAEPAATKTHHPDTAASDDVNGSRAPDLDGTKHADETAGREVGTRSDLVRDSEPAQTSTAKDIKPETPPEPSQKGTSLETDRATSRAGSITSRQPDDPGPEHNDSDRKKGWFEG